MMYTVQHPQQTKSFVIFTPITTYSPIWPISQLHTVFVLFTNVWQFEKLLKAERSNCSTFALLNKMGYLWWEKWTPSLHWASSVCKTFSTSHLSTLELCPTLIAISALLIRTAWSLIFFFSCSDASYFIEPFCSVFLLQHINHTKGFEKRQTFLTNGIARIHTEHFHSLESQSVTKDVSNS